MIRMKLKHGEQPTAPCPKKFFNEGTQLAILAGPRSWDIENWTIDVNEQLPKGTEVDWTFQGGRAFVLGVGNIEKIRAVMEKLKPALEETYKLAQAGQNHICELTFRWCV